MAERPIYLSLPHDLNVEVRGDFEFDPEEIETLAHTYLPGLTLRNESVEPKMTVEYIESDERRLEKDEDIIRIYDDWGGKLSLDIWHMLYGVARLRYFENQEYPVHAACAGLDKHVLLIGHSGYGKSTILLNLLNNYGWKAYSGNKTVISLKEGKMEAVAGTKAMSLKSTDSTKYPNLTARKIEYQNRTAFILDEKHYSEETSVPISTIYVAKLNDGVAEREELTFPANLHTLYAFFMDTVNADTVMCGGNDVFVGTPSEGSQVKLAKALNYALRGVKVIKISGSVDFVTREIAEK